MAKSCYLGGATDKLTADHVIPKFLFPEPRPSNLITEDACGRATTDSAKTMSCSLCISRRHLAAKKPQNGCGRIKPSKHSLEEPRSGNSACSRRHEEEGSDRAWWCRGRRSQGSPRSAYNAYYFESPRALFGISIQHSTTRISISPFAYGPRRRASNSFKTSQRR